MRKSWIRGHHWPDSDCRAGGGECGVSGSIPISAWSGVVALILVLLDFVRWQYASYQRGPVGSGNFLGCGRLAGNRCKTAFYVSLRCQSTKWEIMGDGHQDDEAGLGQDENGVGQAGEMREMTVFRHGHDSRQRARSSRSVKSCQRAIMMLDMG